MNRNSVDKIFWGIILIIIGIVFLLNNLDVIDFSIWYVFSRYWPVILIYIGIKNIVIYTLDKNEKK